MNRLNIFLGAMLMSLAMAPGLDAQEAGTGAATASGLWDLRRCIDYALEHNLTVKSQSITVAQNAIDLNTSKNSRLPDLSASASQNFSFGRGLSESNTYVNTNTASTSFSLGASLNVFNGFRTERTIKMNALNLEAAYKDLEKAKDDIRVQVAQAYVQILYNQEILDVARRQVGIDSLQVERLRAMEAGGKASPAEVAQQVATLGQSRLTATQAQNTLDLSVLDLTQLLELPSPEGFMIVSPDPDKRLAVNGNAEDIYAEAVLKRPAIRAEEFRLDAAEKNILIAKSALMPSLSLNGGIGSNYYKSSGFASANFFDQMNNNFSQYVGASLNIPIFARLSTRNSIASARLSRNNQALQLENVKKTLYKEIQQAWYNAVAAETKLESCEDACESAETSFDLVQAKYENGKSTITEFNESKNALMKAESDLVQAKYEHIFQVKILDFYRGEELAL